MKGAATPKTEADAQQPFMEEGPLDTNPCERVTTRNSTLKLEVRLYGLLSCPHCKAAREYLKENGEEFETVFVGLLTRDERSEALKELRRLNPACSFPTTVIGEKVIVGFKKDEIASAIGKAA